MAKKTRKTGDVAQFNANCNAAIDDLLERAGIDQREMRDKYLDARQRRRELQQKLQVVRQIFEEIDRICSHTKLSRREKLERIHVGVKNVKNWIQVDRQG